MEKTVFVCDATGDEVRGHQCIGIKTFTPFADNDKVWGELHIKEDLMECFDNPRLVSILVEGITGMGGRTAHPRILGITTQGRRDTDMDKTIGRETVHEEFGGEIIRHLEQAIRSRFVASSKQNMYDSDSSP